MAAAKFAKPIFKNAALFSTILEDFPYYKIGSFPIQDTQRLFDLLCRDQGAVLSDVSDAQAHQAAVGPALDHLPIG